MVQHNINDISRFFCSLGDFISSQPYGTGHINDTFLVNFKNGEHEVRYVFQRINHSIFKNPPSLMDNMVRVTNHIRSKLKSAGQTDISRQVLTIIPTLEGMSYFQDPAGSYWRSTLFIEEILTYDVLETPQQAYQAAKAFGRFQRHLVDLLGPALAETIPDFHNTPNRLGTFLQVLEKDPCNRAYEIQYEINFILKNAAMCDVLTDLMKNGLIPQRITHNDTKINNVLFDKDTNEGVCVIDLDTVMPGLSLYDFGDMVRTATCKAAEDERDLLKIHMDIEFFEQIARGYALETAEFFTNTEKEYLAFSGKLITFEQMIRFLTDYLRGDVYYKIDRPGHNLDRARTQMKLVQSIQEQENQMNKLTEDIWKTL